MRGAHALERGDAEIISAESADESQDDAKQDANERNLSGTFSGTYCRQSGSFVVICSVFVRGASRSRAQEALYL